MKMPKSRYRQLTDPLGERWTNADLRLEIFFWLWNAIKQTYAVAWQEAESKADQGEKAQLFQKVGPWQRARLLS